MGRTISSKQTGNLDQPSSLLLLMSRLYLFLLPVLGMVF